MENLYDEYKGAVQINNVDISETIIEKMKGRNSSRSKMNCKPYPVRKIMFNNDFMLGSVMDVLSLNFPSNNFDVIIDKGTIDSIVVSIVIL